MLALTLSRPWPDAFPMKDIENRKWRPPPTVIGQRIALHSAQSYDYDGHEFMRPLVALYPRIDHGWIFATTRVLGYVHRTCGLKEWIAEPATLGVVSSPWLFGPYGWVLDDTVMLSKRVRARGAQGLWKLPELIEMEVLQREQEAR